MKGNAESQFARSLAPAHHFRVSSKNCASQKICVSVTQFNMAFFQSAVSVLQTLVIALGAGLGIWGAINLLEGYGNDNPGAKSQGMKHLMPD